MTFLTVYITRILQTTDGTSDYYLRHHPGQGAVSRSLGGGWVEVGGLT